MVEASVADQAVVEAAPVVVEPVPAPQAEEVVPAAEQVAPVVAQPEPVVAPLVTKPVAKGAGVLARARKASAPMATPAAVPAPAPHEPVEQAPLERSEVVSSGRHGGSTAAVNVATSPAGRP